MANLMVTKRDGRVVPFDMARIERAVRRCMDEENPGRTSPDSGPRMVAGDITSILHERGVTSIGVEEIQDRVEDRLMRGGWLGAAKRYILYRAEHARQREDRPVPPDVKMAFDDAAAYFPTPLQQFQFFDKYSRYNYDLGRRETWIETVDRSVDYLYELGGDRLPSETYQRIRQGILDMRVTPSMRLLAMAGAPARRDATTIYNCSYLTADSLDSFKEALLISMAGCGVGFSVEAKYVDQLPLVWDKQSNLANDILVVEDSAEGWANALYAGLQMWFSGREIYFDYSQVRPSGTVLKTKGGRASGHEPLEKMLNFVRSRIRARAGMRLRPIDAHDLMCAVGNAAVSGGVRRTAMISLFDEGDEAMLHAKDPGFDAENAQRWNANNSMVWKDVATMDQAVFADRFLSMVKSGNGEPGIFSRDAARRLMPKRRDSSYEFGCNPCGEINLRPMEFCNLSAAIVRSGDGFEDLNEKVELATIIGSLQSLATHFPSLRPQWKANCEEERLLGVDITGQQDNPLLLSNRHMQALRSTANFYAARTAEALGINKPAAITCVKPSGNTSQLVNCASGLHARWAPYYIRNVRAAASSPVARVLLDAGVPHSPENNEDPENPRTWVFSFPVKSPDGAVTRLARSATDQCEWWLRNKLHWTEHNPSVTITYRPDEVIDLMKWVWDHRDKVGGMAFLPAFDAKYDQLPYVEVTQEEYEKRVAEFTEIDFSKIFRHEQTDMSTASTTLACEGDRCLVE